MPTPNDQPAKPQRANLVLKILGGVAGVFVLLIILGLVSKALGLDKKDEPTPAAAPTTVAPATTSAAAPPAAASSEAPAPTTAAAAAPCYPQRAIDDPDLAAFVAGLQLPAEVQVVTGRVSKQSDKPGLVGVAIDLCVPASKNADALRPIATDIAKALKVTDLGSKTFALFISDMDPDYKTDAKIKDPDFKLHAWNGQPSAKVELATWQVVG